MKYLAFWILICSFLSCVDEQYEKLECIEIEYDTRVSMQLDDIACFPNGNTMTLVLIEDNFCPCESDCVFPGELNILIETENESGDSELLSFGSEGYNIESIVFDGYKISNFDFLYKGSIYNLPDCNNEFDPRGVEVILKISKI